MERKIKQKKAVKTVAILFITAAAIFLFARFSSAQTADLGISYGDQIGLSSEDPRIIVARVIRIVLGFLGVIAVALTIYAGWMIMTAGGGAEKVDKGKRILKNALIGLAIILASWAIATFILSRFLSATNQGVSGDQSGGGPGGPRIGALGSGIVASHYPARDQTEVPRNTKIMITFREAIKPDTLINDTNGNGISGDCANGVCDKVKAENVKIYKTVEGSANPIPVLADVSARTDEAGKVFVFKPDVYLGSPSEKIWYSVILTSAIKKADNSDAFPGAGGGYSWSFQVSDFVDITPPKISSVAPEPDAREPKNVIVQINFDEAIDPLSAAGLTSKGFDNISVLPGSELSPVAGGFYVSNQYRTVEFISENECGTNSCGDRVYCLPGGKTISVSVKAASLVSGEDRTAVFPYDGIVDMADNSLDGNGDGRSDGPKTSSSGALGSGQDAYNLNEARNLSSAALENYRSGHGDDYLWSFITTDETDTTAPKILSVFPESNGRLANLDEPLKAVFSKLISGTSLDGENVVLSGAGTSYWISKEDDKNAKRTTVLIRHDRLTAGGGYSAYFNSKVKDIYQNCFFPCSGAGCSASFSDASCCEGTSRTGESCP